MFKKIWFIIGIIIFILLVFGSGFFTGYFSRQTGFNKLRAKLNESDEINRKLREFEDEFGITIEEFSNIYKELRSETTKLREEIKNKDKIYLEFIESIEQYQKGTKTGLYKIGPITERLRSEIKRNLSIIRKYTKKE